VLWKEWASTAFLFASNTRTLSSSPPSSQVGGEKVDGEKEYICLQSSLQDLQEAPLIYRRGRGVMHGLKLAIIISMHIPWGVRRL
jgi:hypothetical protein